jgi:hypothetical protein
MPAIVCGLTVLPVALAQPFLKIDHPVFFAEMCCARGGMHSDAMETQKPAG